MIKSKISYIFIHETAIERKIRVLIGYLGPKTLELFSPHYLNLDTVCEIKITRKKGPVYSLAPLDSIRDKINSTFFV